jgi:hypothetical protein
MEERVAGSFHQMCLRQSLIEIHQDFLGKEDTIEHFLMVRKLHSQFHYARKRLRSLLFSLRETVEHALAL